MLRAIEIYLWIFSISASYGYLLLQFWLLKGFSTFVFQTQCRTEFLCIHKTWIGFPCLGFLRENFWYCWRWCLVVLFRCGWKSSDEYEWENNVSDPLTLSEVHNNFLGKRCEGGQLDYSHRFRAESMSILFSIFFKPVEDCKKFLDDCLDGRPQIDDVEDWLLRLLTRFVVVLAK